MTEYYILHYYFLQIIGIPLEHLTEDLIVQNLESET